MIIFIAGGLSGNLGQWFYEGEDYMANEDDKFYKRFNILESYYYIKDWQTKLIPKFNSFMLDSGAFTFMYKKNKNQIDFEKYTYDYCEYINKNNINLFIEMDIDKIVGIKEVERLRNILIKETNKIPIIVFHKSRGKDYFLNMVKEFKYIAIGGLVKKEFGDLKYINWFCEEAHKNNCLIHGLGFTGKKLNNYQFDSVDSTSWLYGNRGKFIYEFNGKNMVTHSMDHKEFSLKSRDVAVHNFMEWVKYGEYLAGNSYKRQIYLAGLHGQEIMVKRQIYLAETGSRDYLFE